MSPHNDAEPFEGAKADKREQIVQAAVEVLRTEGVAACTARRIADASPLTKSSLHYYFDDVQQVVDLAMARLMNEYVARISGAAAAAPDPLSAFWAAVEAFLVLGTSHPRRIPMLWFEYVITAVRRGRTDLIRQIIATGRGVFEDLLSAAGIPDPGPRARIVVAVLAGVVYEQSILPRDMGGVLRDLSVAIAVPLPEREGAGT